MKQKYQIGDKVRICRKNRPKNPQNYNGGWVDELMKYHNKIGTISNFAQNPTDVFRYYLLPMQLWYSQKDLRSVK